eukprot:scaffold2407_cov117-Isochrysis_galbana.AAC.2
MVGGSLRAVGTTGAAMFWALVCAAVAAPCDATAAAEGAWSSAARSPAPGPALSLKGAGGWLRAAAASRIPTLDPSRASLFPATRSDAEARPAGSGMSHRCTPATGVASSPAPRATSTPIFPAPRSPASTSPASRSPASRSPVSKSPTPR